MTRNREESCSVNEQDLHTTRKKHLDYMAHLPKLQRILSFLVTAIL